MDYKTDEYLMLSGIQHYEFCPRQWALIHIEQQWEENLRTVQGQHLHRNADQPFMKEKRGNKIVSRSMHVQSHELAITGICDVVEFIKDEAGVEIPKLGGKYKIYPVEYKRGKPKTNHSDILQLVAQSMCLEVMLVCTIDKGYLFYNEVKHRETVLITEELKHEVKTALAKMQDLYRKKHTPRVKTGKWCKSCSLQDICLPRLMTKESVDRYIEKRLSE
jgi:CRISPR-associated exonuclease Cas4